MPDRNLRYVVTADTGTAASGFSTLANAATTGATQIGSAFSKVGQQIGGEVGEAFSKVAEGLDALGSNSAKASERMAAIGSAAVGLGFILVSVGANEKRAADQLKLAIDNTGSSYEDYSKQIEETIKQQEGFGHTSEETMGALQRLTEATQDPAKAIAEMGVTADLAAAKHISLASAAQLVARILGGGGGKILHDYGLQMQLNADGTKNADATLALLAARLNGQAAASVDNFNGKIDVLIAKIKDWVSSIGQAAGPYITLLGAGVDLLSAALAINEIRVKGNAAAQAALAAGEVAAAEGAATEAEANVALAATQEAVAGGARAQGMSFLAGAGMIGIYAGAAVGAIAAGKLLETWLNSAAAAADKEVESFSTLNNQIATTTDGLTGLTANAIASTLITDGLAEKAEKAGVSLGDLTTGLVGSDEGFASLVETWKKGGQPSNDTLMALYKIRFGLLDAEDASKKLKEAQDKLNQSTSDLTPAEQAQAKALGLTETAYSTAQAAADKKKASDDANRAALILETGATKEAAAGLKLTQEGYANAKEAADKHTQSTKDATAAMQLENDAAGLLKQGLDLLNGKTIDLTEAQFAMRDALKTVRDGIKDNGHDLRQNTDAGEANTKAIFDAIKAAQNYALAQNKNGVSAKQATKDYLANRDAIREQLIQMGFVPAQVDALIKSYAQVPALVTTQADLDTENAEKRAAQLKDDINKIHQDKIPSVTADTKAGKDVIDRLTADINNIKQGKIPGLTADKGPGKKEVDALQKYINDIAQGEPVPLSADPKAGIDAAASLQRAITDIKQGKLPGIDANTKAGKDAINELQDIINGLTGKTVPVSVVYQQFIAGGGGGSMPLGAPSQRASGGWISGPGTETSDSVLALLSKNEFVVSARHAKKYGRLLEAINRGMIPGFADGGIVLDLPSPKSVTAGADAAVNSLIAGLAPKIIAQMSATVGGDLGGWIAQALAITGTDPSWAAAIARRINFESGGNVTAQNNWDSNAAAGDPSRGLMQTIMSTFLAYHQPGTSSNIFDPVANISAAINYIKARYGSIFAIDPPVQGYEYGGPVNQTGLALVHEGEQVLANNDARKYRQTGDKHTTMTVNVYPRAAQSEHEIGVIVARELAWAARTSA